MAMSAALDAAGVQLRHMLGKPGMKALLCRAGRPEVDALVQAVVGHVMHLEQFEAGLLEEGGMQALVAGVRDLVAGAQATAVQLEASLQASLGRAAAAAPPALCATPGCSSAGAVQCEQCLGASLCLVCRAAHSCQGLGAQEAACEGSALLPSAPLPPTAAAALGVSPGRLLLLLCLTLCHLCLTPLAEALLAATGDPALALQLAAGSAAAQQLRPAQPRQCTPAEAATLAGGLTWALEEELSTAYQPEEPPSALPSFRRTDIAALNASAPPPLEYVPHLGSGCSPRAMTPLRMRACLRGRPVLFVGDSVTRYQYLGLVQALDTGLHIPWVPASEHDNLFGTWHSFFATTNERLSGHGACDCWRPPNEAPQEVCSEGLCAWAVSGSRYYVWPEQGLDVSFLETLGGSRSPPAAVWHEPATYFGLHCGNGSSSGEGEAAGAAAAAPPPPCLPPSAPPLCAPGWCSAPPDHVQPIWSALRAMVARTHPAILLLNSGLWGVQWSGEPGGNVAALMSALDWAAGPGGVQKVLWKTTTHQLTGEGEAFDDRPLRTQAEGLVVAAFQARGWGVLQAGAATEQLAEAALVDRGVRERVFVDAVHYTRSIYRGLNELFVSMVCEGGEGGGEVGVGVGVGGGQRGLWEERGAAGAGGGAGELGMRHFDS